MIVRKIGRVCLALACFAAVAGTAVAQPHPDRKERREERREERKERREERKEAREERREERREAREERREARHHVHEARRALVEAHLGGASPEELQKRADELIAARKDLVGARQAARKMHKEHLREYLKQAHHRVDKALVRAELGHHARRVAHLSRIREVAKENGDTETVTKVEAALAREQARHQARMERIAGHGDATGGTEGGTEGGTP